MTQARTTTRPDRPRARPERPRARPQRPPASSPWPSWPLPLALALAGLLVMVLSTKSTPAAPTPVSVFPIPGARVAAPQTQIAFRGLPAKDLGRIVVTGSKSGRHWGRVMADSDGDGGSFLPAKPFTAGERVTVRTGLDIRGVRKGTFSFLVATPAGAIPLTPLSPATRTTGDVMSFESRPDLTPAAVEVVKKTPQDAPGDIFLTPQVGPLQNGPMIVNGNGNLVWFHAVPKGDMAADFRVQRFEGKPVLTWWQGYSGAGLGFGEDVIFNSAYKQIAVVRAANGLSADLHEFQLTPQGTALITAYYPVYWNASRVHGSTQEIVLDAVVQEIDVKTGLVLFQWDSLDHVPLSATHESLPGSVGQPFDYFHVNSVEQQAAGNLIISARNTWAAYNVDGKTGRVIWTLGGRDSSFRMEPGTSFAFQHDVHVSRGDDETVTVFDDGAGPPTVQSQSRGLTLLLDPHSRTVTLAGQDEHSPALLASWEGNVQRLADGDQFVGWGQQPYFTEFSSSGQTLFDARFVDDNSSYRAYEYSWQGAPRTQPAVAVSASGSAATVYASWNGATQVASWRALGGTSKSSLHVLGSAPTHGFETQIDVRNEPYVEVQAVDAGGQVLGSSKVIATS